MTKPLDELYFSWLCRQVGEVEISVPDRTYLGLLRLLFNKEFVWHIPNDDNRAEDGRDLRQEFIDDLNVPGVPDSWMDLGCSMFELMIGLSRRLSFQAEGEPRFWFWELVENLDLEKYNDASLLRERHIDHILDVVIWRTYRRNGRGGLFPLKHPHEDQRFVELWYQLNAYVLEKG